MSKVIFLHKNQYNAIDLMKWICAIFVVAIHANPLASLNETADFFLTNVFAQMAVPLFFLAAGFLFFRKFDLHTPIQLDSYRISLVQKYLIRIIVLYGVWTVLYLPFRLGEWIGDGFSWLTIVLFVRDFLFDGSYYHLWFLPSCAFAVFLTFSLLTKVKIETVLLLAFILFVIGIFGDSYYGILARTIPALTGLYDKYFSVFLTTRNGLFFGFLFVAAGAYISQIRSKINQRRIYVFFGLFFMLLTLEAFVLHSTGIPKPYSYNLLFMLIPASVFLFLGIINMQIGNHKTDYHLYRKMSTLIFVSHVLFINLTTRFLTFFSFTSINHNSLLKFLIALVLTILFSNLVIKCSKKKKLPFLKYLY